MVVFILLISIWFILSTALNISTTPPERPLSPTAINIGDSFIVLEWQYPSSISTITECVVKATKTTDNNLLTIYRGSETVFNYTNLTHGTRYSITLICENECCWSSYSQTVIYSTLKQQHYCDSNADRIWEEIWYSSNNNNNVYTVIDEESGECILSHDGQVNPRYQINEECSSECQVQEASDYFEYITKTGIKVITTGSSTESYVIAANQKYKNNNMLPHNVYPILNSNDLNNLCFNKSLNNTMGLIWYTQVHWPLYGYDNYKANLKRFYSNGLRIFMIAYGSNSNQQATERLGSGSNEMGGLTQFGAAVVTELNNIGFIIDCSHCNNQTTVETAIASTTPIIANHANVYNIALNIRTMKDDAIQVIVNNGGVIGIMPLKRFISSNMDVSINDVLQHIDYIVTHYGDEYVGVSTDWYMDNIHEYSVWDYIDPYINSWKRWKFIACFLSIQPYNYQYTRIRKIMAGNFQRVYREIFDAHTNTPTTQPTINPTTNIPTNIQPTINPTTNIPTNIPTTQPIQPTINTMTNIPTNIPTTQPIQPTINPTTNIPTTINSINQTNNVYLCVIFFVSFIPWFILILL